MVMTNGFWIYLTYDETLLELKICMIEIDTVIEAFAHKFLGCHASPFVYISG